MARGATRTTGKRDRTDDKRTSKRMKRKTCRLCADKIESIDYKDVSFLRTFIKSDSGKIFARRTTGNCALHQRQVTLAIKRARNIALLPFTTKTRK